MTSSPATPHYFTWFPIWLAYVLRIFHTVGRAYGLIESFKHKGRNHLIARVISIQ